MRMHSLDAGAVGSRRYFGASGRGSREATSRTMREPACECRSTRPKTAAGVGSNGS